jgi:hypothetical protein
MFSPLVITIFFFSSFTVTAFNGGGGGGGHHHGHHGPGHHFPASTTTLLDITINGLPNRVFPNVSLGHNYHYEEQGHQCNTEGFVKGQPAPSDLLFEQKTGMKLGYTPNRRLQANTLKDGLHQRLQMAVVLAVGGHSDSHYNYGPGGSINGLMAVWDSWLENFFSVTSNTSSLILLFDERDFKRQNDSQTHKEYLDKIVVGNMNAEPVDCVQIRGRHGIQEMLHTRAYGTGLPNAGAGVDRVEGKGEGRGEGRERERHGHRAHGQSGLGGAQNAWGPTVTGLEPSYRLGCSNELHLDSGYRVYFIDPSNLNTTDTFNRKPNRPFLIFAAVHSFPKAEWVEEGKHDEDELFKNWKPFRLNRRYPTNYGYVKMTNWYAYYMLKLTLLDYFDYASKLDNDVSFVAPFPDTNVPLTMAQGEHLMLATQNGWYHDDPRISQGVQHCLYSYVSEESKYCQRVFDTLQKKDPTALTATESVTTGKTKVYKAIEFMPSGYNDSTFFQTNFNTTFRAHFLVYWLGLYTAPETMHMAKYWNFWHPRGMWDFRWGDQQWWPRPIAFFGSGNLEREIFHYDLVNTDNEKYVVHKQWPRWGTIPKTNYYNPVNGSTKLDRDELYKIASKPFIY